MGILWKMNGGYLQYVPRVLAREKLGVAEIGEEGEGGRVESILRERMPVALFSIFYPI